MPHLPIIQQSAQSFEIWMIPFYISMTLTICVGFVPAAVNSVLTKNSTQRNALEKTIFFSGIIGYFYIHCWWISFPIFCFIHFCLLLNSAPFGLFLFITFLHVLIYSGTIHEIYFKRKSPI